MTKRKKARVYTEVFKLKVLRDFYSSGESAWSIARKWEIDPNSLYQWKRRWPIGSKELSLPAETLAKIPMPKPTPEKNSRGVASGPHNGPRTCLGVGEDAQPRIREDDRDRRV